MTKRQILAVKRLERALTQCHNAGLEGGVYDGSFCVWPTGSFDILESGNKFFGRVEEYGATLDSPMTLDGGAGV